MLLAVSIASLVTISLLAFVRTGDALSDAAVEKLTNQRIVQASRVTEYLQTVEHQAETMSQDRMVIEAMLEFRIGFAQLESDETTPEQQEEMDNFYHTLLTELGAESSPAAVELHHPTGNAGRYLQRAYIMPGADEPALVDSVADGTFYDRVHERFHPPLRNFVDTFRHYDLFLVDATTHNIVYTVGKEIDYGTNLATGPYANTPLATAVDAALRQAEPGDASFADFAFYRPSGDQPAAFVASPIVAGGSVIGVLVLQLSDAEITRVSTVEGQWSEAGFGETGETYLVGNDLLMRSQARLLVEDQDRFISETIAAGLSKAEAALINEHGSAVLLQPVATEAVAQAQLGNSATGVSTNYRGAEVLTSYGPLEFEGLDWVIVAEVELDEARGPQRDLQRDLLIAASLIVLVVTALAVLLASRFVRPIGKLLDWARAVTDGDTDVELDLRSADEFGDLGHSFQSMVTSMKAERDLLIESNRQNKKLLGSMMPDSVAQRLRDGEQDIVDTHPDVVIIDAKVTGYGKATRSMTPAESFETVSELISTFDEIAAEFSIQKIKIVSDSYLAVCGLVEKRLDQERLALSFVAELEKAVERFSLANGMELGLRAGISTGSAEAGIVGTTNPMFEVLGEPVEEAIQLASRAEPGQILVATAVQETLADAFDFEPHSDGVWVVADRSGVSQ